LLFQRMPCCGTARVRSLFAAAVAECLNLERPPQRLKPLECRIAIDYPFEPRNLNVANSPAAHAYHMMMRCEVAVEAGAIVKHRDFAGFANLTQRLERAMDGCQRDMRMELAHGLEDRFGAGMIGGDEQCFDDRETLRRHGEAALAAAIGEFRHPAPRIGPASALADDLEVHARW
jgi:hypothetical protein